MTDNTESCIYVYIAAVKFYVIWKCSILLYRALVLYSFFGSFFFFCVGDYDFVLRIKFREWLMANDFFFLLSTSPVWLYMYILRELRNSHRRIRNQGKYHHHRRSNTSKADSDRDRLAAPNILSSIKRKKASRKKNTPSPPFLSGASSVSSTSELCALWFTSSISPTRKRESANYIYSTRGGYLCVKFTRKLGDERGRKGLMVGEWIWRALIRCHSPIHMAVLEFERLTIL